MTSSIVFRTNASKAIGFGHLRRCLTLAQELQRIEPPSAPLGFLVGGDAAAVDLVTRAGFRGSAIEGPEPAATLGRVSRDRVDVLIVDSYEIAEEAFRAWRERLRCLVVVDDLADRTLDADAIVNVSSHARTLAYRTGSDCQLWLGPEYALLRPQFRGLRAREIAANPARVLVTLGGADPANSTLPVVATVLRSVPGATIDVVVGPLFGAMPGISALAASHPGRVRVHQGIDDLAPLMAGADFAVSGGGQTLFELAATGLPTIALQLADNQGPNIHGLDELTLLRAGEPPASEDDARAEVLAAACARLASDAALRASLSRAGQRLVDGHGAARVARLLLSLHPSPRQAPGHPR
jgi:UDP-2,4-diacetamido-2,4,6-trideoxy-beta-L-altropyranose hydrolase